MSKHVSKISRVALFLPLAYLVLQAVQGDLGVQPAKKLNRELGTIGVRLLLLNLYLGIAIALWKPLPVLIRPIARERRWLGVACFAYLVLHVSFYFIETADLEQAIHQMYTKRYLIFGTLAFSIIALLAATSNNFSVRRLGFKKWKRIHRTVYLALTLASIHVLSIEKGDTVMALIYFVPVGILEGFRLARSLLHARRAKTGSAH